MSNRNFKHWVDESLNNPDSKDFSLVNGILVVTTIISVLETLIALSGYGHEHRAVLHLLELPVAILFTFEYAFRVWTTERKKAYILSPIGILDLISFIPTYLGLESLAFLKVARFVRTLRLLRVAGLSSVSKLRKKKDRS